MVDEVPVQLRRICQQLLKKRTEQRYQDCSVLQSDLDAYRMARGQAAVAATAHLAQFVQNPEEYRTRFPDRPVTVATRSAAQHQRKAAASKQVRPGKDAGKESKPVRVSRILGIVAIFVFFFAGLSVAGNFFFSKDGQFGSTAQTPGASRPAESEPGGVTVARRGNENGKASVGSDGAGDVDGGPMASPIGNLKTIVVVGELLESETDTTRQRAEVAPRPASAAPDSVLLQDDPARPRGRVYIKADPWAAVFIDGDSLGVTPLPVVVSPGGYRITLRHPDFPDFETLVDVLPGRESPVEVSLWSLMGLLDLEVEPGVQLFIDGVDRGVTPFEYPLLVSPGKHGLILQHPTHGAYQSSIEIAAGEAQTFRYELNPTP
jgi:serine/threonine-protein kinase